MRTVFTQTGRAGDIHRVFTARPSGGNTGVLRCAVRSSAPVNPPGAIPLEYRIVKRERAIDKGTCDAHGLARSFTNTKHDGDSRETAVA